MPHTEAIPIKDILDNFKGLTNDEIRHKIKTIDCNIKKMQQKNAYLRHEYKSCDDRVRQNQKQIKPFTTRPNLAANIVEINVDNCGGVVIQTSHREKIYLEYPGLINIKEMKINDLVSVSKDNFMIIDKIPNEYDHRIKSMEVISKPTDTYNDIGGLNKQIEELTEVIILPITNKDKFKHFNITPPKGILLYGPPGTGKTLLARCCANQCNATFLKLSSTQLIQKNTGDGIRIIRDLFNYAKQKSPSIIFIDEIDAIGMKRGIDPSNSSGNSNGLLIELLNQIDGFSSHLDIKIIAATNRADILDPALLRSGRIDRKIECPLPNETEREQILMVHANKMNYHFNVNFKSLAKDTDDFNGAQLKAVTIEAGMNALRRNDDILIHQDFVYGIKMVNNKKKLSLNYYE